MTGSHASQLFGNRVVVDWGRGRIRAFTANRRSFGRTYSAFPRVLEGAVPSKLMVSCRLAIPIAFFRYAVPRSQIGWRCLRPWLWRGRGSVLSALKCIRDSVQRTCSKNLNLTKPPSTPPSSKGADVDQPRNLAKSVTVVWVSRMGLRRGIRSRSNSPTHRRACLRSRRDSTRH